MKINRCVYCMEDLGDAPVTVCPKCRFDNAKAAQLQSPYAMGQNTILHGRYLVGRVLGQGGFGITYLAFDLVLSIKVAIKEYFPMGIAMRDPGSSNTLLWHSTQMNTEQRQSGQESFLKEARRIARIDQIPSIVRVRDTFFDNETAYIVMDYVEGITLKDKLLKGGIISFSECMRYLTPMMEGLAQVHKAGIIHRDISPDNIIIQADGSVKLLDLGAAKDISMGQGQQSQLVAKKGFSPLEQYTEAGKIGPWTDVYALCATIYYSITGRMVPNALDRIGNEGNLFPNDTNTPVEAHVRAALEAGLALEAGNRIQSVGELLERLRGGNTQSKTAGRDGKQEDKSEEKPKKPKSKKWRIAAGAAGLLVVLGIACGRGREAEPTPVPATGVAEIEDQTGIGTGMGAQEDTLVVENLGTPNANVLNYGGDASFPDEYEYYIAADSALYLCTYDQEDETFYLGDDRRVCEDAGYITLGGEKVYFVATVDGKENVCRMNKDGSDLLRLYTAGEGQDIQFLQYAEFSDQRKYLYFLPDNVEDGLVGGSICRYNLENDETESVVEGEILWYNLYEDSIYFTELTQDYQIALSRTGLDGGDRRILDTERQFMCGFAVEDTLYLISLRDDALLACNLDGTPRSGCEGFYQLEMDTDSYFGYGDGWIYYNGMDGNVHKVRGNGTGDSIWMEDISAMRICYDRSWLWILDRQPTEKIHQYKDQVYMVHKDGDNCFTLMEPDYVWGLTLADESDFQYETEEDGVVVTGYTGELTSFTIPDEIAGRPVVAIGEEAFKGSSVEEVGLQEGLREIRDSAFTNCSKLSFIGLPEGLETIEYCAFAYCGRLTGVDLPESLVHIGTCVFVDTALSQVHIPANVAEIWQGAFGVAFDAGFTQFTISSENRFFEVHEGVLYERELDSFDEPIPGELMYLVAVPSGFTGSIVVPDGVVEFYARAFRNCYWLTDVYVPQSVPKIYNVDFDNAVIDSLTVSRECDLPSDCSFARTINYY